jgi:hypothetical protein
MNKSIISIAWSVSDAYTLTNGGTVATQLLDTLNFFRSLKKGPPTMKLASSLARFNSLVAVALLIGLFTLSSPAIADVIFTNPITGSNPNTSNPYTTGQTFSPNITVSGIGRGPGAVGTNANDRYNANSWNTASIDLSAYFTWTLDAINGGGNHIDFANLALNLQRSSTGPTSFAFRSSLDGFVANIDSFTTTTSISTFSRTIDLSGASFQDLVDPIEFRLYAWTTSNSGGTFSVNDFTFNGTAIPEPAAFVFGTVVSGMLGVVYGGKALRRRWFGIADEQSSIPTTAA